ncbi:MAG: glycoside hydrolase, partial [Pseudomonadota bacterium]
VLSFEPGTSITQTSSLSNSVAYLRDLIGSRWEDKPFIVSEHQHLFWNRYRYESGLLVPAIAALQDWDGICRHGPGPIDLTTDTDLPHKKRIMPYAIGLDPVARAAETLTALIYRRGDATRSPVRLLIPHATTKDMLDDGQGRWPDEITKLGLVTGIALSNSTTQLAPTASSPEHSITKTILDRTPFETQSFWRKSAFADTVIAKLQAQKLFPAPSENATKTADGVFQSDTGQLKLDTNNRQATFVSEHTEAIAFDTLSGKVELGALTLKDATPQGLFSISALDDQPVTGSSRLLIIYATDARNSEMQFSDTSAREILNYGHRPTILRKGKLEAVLQTSRPGSWKLHRLDLTGRITVSHSLKQTEGRLAFALSNTSKQEDPTTYWLLEQTNTEPPAR